MRKKSSSKVLATAIIAALLLNTTSSAIARAYWHISGETGATLTVAREAEPGEPMNYLIAGSYNQPTAAFDHWLTNELDGGITYVMYSPLGCNLKLIANQVIADIRAHDHPARIFGISIGDYVSRQAEAQLDDVRTFPINPEPEPSTLRPGARAASIGGGILLEALSLVAGWASIIPTPLMQTAAGPTTLAHFADQLLNIGLIKAPPHAIDNVEAIFLSGYSAKRSLDQFLQNSKLLKYFKGARVFWVHSDHGNTVDQVEGYRRAWAEYKAWASQQGQ